MPQPEALSLNAQRMGVTVLAEVTTVEALTESFGHASIELQGALGFVLQLGAINIQREKQREGRGRDRIRPPRE